MAVIEIKDFLENKEEYEVLSVDEVKQKLNELDIASIDLGGETTYRYSDEKIINFLYTDYNHPIVLRKDEIFDKNTLHINQEWYLENQEVCEELFRYVCSNVDKKSFSIGSSLIVNNKLIEALCLNKNLESVSLAEFDDTPYALTKEDYLKFKSSNIKKVETKLVDDELKDNFDDLIDFNKSRRLISYYTYEKLQYSDELYINEELSEEEILNLKYVPVGVEIRFVDDSFKNLSRIIQELNKLSKNNKLIIRVEDKEKFNVFLLENNIDYDNLYVELGVNKYNIKDYLKFEKRLYDMVSQAKNLSPFEKYIYAYNVSKSFKKYKENEEDKSASRNLYSILINDYMVCVGFANMFGDLLNKLGISNHDLSVSVEISYDKDKVDEENFTEAKVVEFGGHARRYVHIVDEKYGIDGFYIADPTWDNDLDKDYYNNLAMTNDEALNARRYLKIKTYDSSELFFVSSIEEYIEKVKFLLNHDSISLKDLVRDLLKYRLSKLDSEYVEKLKERYVFLKDGFYSMPDNINELVYELGIYIVEHVNKEISGEVIMDAVSNVYRNAYGYSDEEQLDIKMAEIIKYNKERQEKAFPVRYNVKEDGSREKIMNERNKFDIEYSNKIR